MLVTCMCQVKIGDTVQNEQTGETWVIETNSQYQKLSQRIQTEKWIKK